MRHREYTISQGDSLAHIAERYGMTWRELYNFDGGTGVLNRDRLRSNDPDRIYPGEVILVPENNVEPAQPVAAAPGTEGADKNVYTPAVGIPLNEAAGSRTIAVKEVVIHDGTEHVQEPEASRRQYVNREEDSVFVEHGRRLRFKARYVEEQGGQKIPLAGETIYWHAGTVPGNKEGLIQQLQAGFDAPGSGTIVKEVTTDADGWTPVVEFYVSQYGGDTFTIVATDEQPDVNASPMGESAGTFEVWRELRYELDCMNRPRGGTYANRANTTGMGNELARTFVEVHQVGTDSSPRHQRVLQTAEAQDWAENIRHSDGEFWHRRKQYFHLLLVDTIVRGESSEREIRERLSPGDTTITLPASQYTLDPRDWFVEAKFWQEHMGHTRIWGELKYTTLREDNFTLREGGSAASGNDHYILTIDFPEEGLLSSGYDAAERAHVVLKVKTWPILSGVQFGPATVVGLRWRERAKTGRAISDSTLNTMLHEAAHAFGLAATTLPDGSNCNTTYFKNGHHCNNDSNTCVMYESNTGNTRPCANCADALRGRVLSELPIRGDASYD